ncbi:MAG: hypothetical protein GW903_08205 [Alphaproteobacteria bacterium]|nr:hypothetical protein [Alphaproteobacteria bacterium]NCQ88806.1 hypothetical protein [Alphaproteobacteria bacterium]NCT07271.1 hypothetical protein [Alphaproteobacteria bacterium]
MKQITPASALKTAATLVPDDPIADAPLGRVIQLFPPQSIVDTVDTQTALSALFGIPANNGELKQHQFERQKALQDAVIAFSQAVLTEIKPIIAVRDLPLQIMQQQQQRGSLLKMTPDERAALQERQINAQRALLSDNRTALRKSF